MSNYKHILVSVDLSDESLQVLNKAKALADSECLISIIHVVEPLTFAYGGDIPIDLTEIQTQLEQQARQKMDSLIEQSSLKINQQHIIVGQPTSEIHDLADSLNADIIVVGSHGRKGLALLLGSTANGVIHGAKCDVLAVRITP